ncbi:MAG TPA: hypothetical protein VLE89_08715 [Chlamydiales bacterium]|nr:hypothetical protein [Chlamydiales bacterium]
MSITGVKPTPNSFINHSLNEKILSENQLSAHRELLCDNSRFRKMLEMAISYERNDNRLGTFATNAFKLLRTSRELIKEREECIGGYREFCKERDKYSRGFRCNEVFKDNPETQILIEVVNRLSLDEIRDLRARFKKPDFNLREVFIIYHALKLDEILLAISRDSKIVSSEDPKKLIDGYINNFSILSGRSNEYKFNQSDLEKHFGNTSEIAVYILQYCSFINREGTGDYCFNSLPFCEYFTACRNLASMPFEEEIT